MTAACSSSCVTPRAVHRSPTSHSIPTCCAGDVSPQLTFPARRCLPTCGEPAAVLHLVPRNIQQKLFGLSSIVRRLRTRLLSCRAASPRTTATANFCSPQPEATHRGAQACGASSWAIFVRRLVARTLAQQFAATDTIRALQFMHLVKLAGVIRIIMDRSDTDPHIHVWNAEFRG